MRKKSICFFLHFNPGVLIPLYVQYYVNELSRYFDEVRLITNHRDKEINPVGLSSNIQLRYKKNEGYDFGMFFKGFSAVYPENYYRIACVNDSNLLIKPLNKFFEWHRLDETDFCGLVDSNEAPWFSTHKNSYHIQSHFIVFNEKAIALLPEFFRQTKPEKLFKEKNIKPLRRKVINDWEIGISQYLLTNGLSGASYYDSGRLLEKNNSRGKNVTHALYEELLTEGYPLIKKKKVLEKKWNLIYKKTKIKRLITRFGNSEWNLEEAVDELYD